jgi:hypothetical protein
MESEKQVTEFWCVHMLGMDELYPAEDRLAAMEWAHGLNVAIMDRLLDRPIHPFDPLVWAVPAVWPYSAESHAESMVKHGTDRTRKAALMREFDKEAGA